MPPGSPMRGRVWRLARLTPCTIARDWAGNMRSTSPVLPLSRPVMTITLSPFLIFSFAMVSAPGSQHFGGERHDLHESACAQLASDRTEDAGANRLTLLGNEDGGIAVKSDRPAIGPADLLCRAHDDCAMHVALLDPAARDCFLDRDDDDVPDRRGLALRAAQHLDALNPTRAGIIGDVECRLHLDHAAPPASPAAAACVPALRRPGAAPSGPPMT